MSRVYHFAPEKWALCDIHKQRLKVATFDKMNDPFELLGIHLGDKDIRQKYRQWRKCIADKWGVLCFSRDWRNPLLWSHYADSHKGICLGFDVPTHLLRAVKYQQYRLPSKHWTGNNEITPLMWTKFTRWKYEKEQRWFVKLQDCLSERELYFWPFGEELSLREVVVGTRCQLSKSLLETRLGNIKDDVKLTKTREAFKTFRIVTQMRGFPD